MKTLADARQDHLIVVSVAKLHLQDRKSLRGGGGRALGHDGRFCDTDGERGGRRACAGETEERSYGHALGLRRAVVTEDVERA